MKNLINMAINCMRSGPAQIAIYWGKPDKNLFRSKLCLVVQCVFQRFVVIFKLNINEITDVEI
jgi:hypothetical protein